MSERVAQLRPCIKATDDVDQFIGSRLRFWRRALNVNSKLLAKRLNITYQQLQKYEKGVNRISASRLYRIASELHIPVSYFYQDVDFIMQSASTAAAIDVLKSRMTTIEFMSTEIAINLCKAFSEIRDPYTKEALLNLIVAVADRDRTKKRLHDFPT